MSEFFRNKHVYDRERITVSTSSIGPTVAKADNTANTDGRFKASCALVEAITNNVWWTWDGSTPSSSNGNKLLQGDVLIVAGQQKLRDFRMVREGASDATIDISYYYG